MMTFRAILLGSLSTYLLATTAFTGQAQNVSLQKKWESEANLLTCESVLHDAGKKMIYVSNINGEPGAKDGNGSIGRVTLAGKVENAEWVKGLDAPKGLGLYRDKLYVADLTKVVVIDTKTGQKLKDIEVTGAEFLNDVTVDSKGQVYVSDSNTGTVFRITNDKSEVWLKNSSLKRINGLLAYQNKIYLIDMNDGSFYQVNESDKSLVKKAEGLKGGDGIVPVGKDEFLISNWNGEVHYVSSNGQTQKLLDTKAEKLNAADIEYIPAQNLLLIPTFFGNKVMAYQLKK